MTIVNCFRKKLLLILEERLMIRLLRSIEYQQPTVISTHNREWKDRITISIYEEKLKLSCFLD